MMPEVSQKKRWASPVRDAQPPGRPRRRGLAAGHRGDATVPAFVPRPRPPPGGSSKGGRSGCASLRQRMDPRMRTVPLISLPGLPASWDRSRSPSSTLGTSQSRNRPRWGCRSPWILARRRRRWKGPAASGGRREAVCGQRHAPHAHLPFRGSGGGDHQGRPGGKRRLGDCGRAGPEPVQRTHPWERERESAARGPMSGGCRAL